MSREKVIKLKQEKKEYANNNFYAYLLGSSERKESIRNYIIQYDKEINFLEKNDFNSNFWKLNEILKEKKCDTKLLVNIFLLEEKIDLLELGILIKSIK